MNKIEANLVYGLQARLVENIFRSNNHMELEEQLWYHIYHVYASFMLSIGPV